MYITLGCLISVALIAGVIVVGLRIRRNRMRIQELEELLYGGAAVAVSEEEK